MCSSFVLAQVKYHPKLRGIHSKDDEPGQRLFTSESMHKHDRFYCFLNVDVRKLPKRGHETDWYRYYRYGVYRNGKWMTPRLGKRDPVFMINCSEHPNVKINFYSVSCNYARMAEVQLLTDIVCEVGYQSIIKAYYKHFNNILKHERACLDHTKSIQ